MLLTRNMADKASPDAAKLNPGTWVDHLKTRNL